MTGPVLAGSTDSFFSRLRENTPEGPILAGFDFPIGVPRAYAEKAGVAHFPVMVRGLGSGSWANFYNPAARVEEISLARPFYPLSPGGTSKKHLLDALGLHSTEELLRLRDRRTITRGSACEIYWTLGANQVGRAAIQGWRELLAPALHAGLTRSGLLTVKSQNFWHLVGLPSWKHIPPRLIATSAFCADERDSMSNGIVNECRQLRASRIASPPEEIVPEVSVQVPTRRWLSRKPGNLTPVRERRREKSLRAPLPLLVATSEKGVVAAPIGYCCGRCVECDGYLAHMEVIEYLKTPPVRNGPGPPRRCRIREHGPNRAVAGLRAHPVTGVRTSKYFASANRIRLCTTWLTGIAFG